jgi:hypothetical protein
MIVLMERFIARSPRAEHPENALPKNCWKLAFLRALRVWSWRLAYRGGSSSSSRFVAHANRPGTVIRFCLSQ